MIRLLTAPAILFASLAIAAASARQFQDPRDGEVYRIQRIGNQLWFAENLRFAGRGRRCYEDKPAHCVEYGGLYRWEEALAACPDGWRLPSDEDWIRLESALGMAEDEWKASGGRGKGLGARLKLGGDAGFDARFAGYLDPHHDYEFRRLGETAAFWSSSPGEPDDFSPTAWHRDVAAGRDVIWRSVVNTPYHLSVRCLKD